MLNQIIALTVKDLKVLLNDRGALAVLFIMPIMFILVMTSANSGGVESGENPVNVLVVNEDAGLLAADTIKDLGEVKGFNIIEDVDNVKLTRDSAEKLLQNNGKYPLVVVFPPDFSSAIKQTTSKPNGPATTVTFVTDPATDNRLLNPVESTIKGFVERTAAMANAPIQIESGFKAIAAQFQPEQASFVQQIGAAFAKQYGAGASGSDSNVRFEQATPKGYKVTVFPKPAEQNVPAYTIFGVFFITQTLAISLVREKQDGTFRRLLVAPLPRAALLIGKLLPYYLVCLVQVVLMFAFGVMVFGMSLGGDLPALALVTMATAGAATGLGLLVASIGKTAEQIGGLTALLAVTLAALGGMFIPSFAMPDFMQKLSQITPHSWALSGYQDVIVRGLGVSSTLNEVSVLLGFTAVFFGIALWRFRFE